MARCWQKTRHSGTTVQRSAAMIRSSGFTLIEVTVALAVFLIVVLALVGSYAWYYGSIQAERFRTIGQTLVQLQAEDIRSLPSSVLKIIVGETDAGGAAGVGVYPPNYPLDTNGDHSVYDSGTIDATYSMNQLSTILGTTASSGSPSVADGFAGLSLPANIQLQKNAATDPDSGSTSYSYTLTLFKETFPNYSKQIVITDETPGETATSDKIFRFQVTVFWTYHGTKQSATFTGETNDARTIN